MLDGPHPSHTDPCSRSSWGYKVRSQTHYYGLKSQPRGKLRLSTCSRQVCNTAGMREPKAVHWRRTVVELREGNWKITHQPQHIGCGSRGRPVRTWRTKLEIIRRRVQLLTVEPVSTAWNELRSPKRDPSTEVSALCQLTRWPLDLLNWRKYSCEKCKQSSFSFLCQLNTYALLYRFVFFSFRLRQCRTSESLSTNLGALTGWAPRRCCQPEHSDLSSSCITFFSWSKSYTQNRVSMEIAEKWVF